MAATADTGPRTSSQRTNVVDGLPAGWPQVREIIEVSVVTDEVEQPGHAGSNPEPPMRLHGTCDLCGFEFYSTATACQAPCPNCGHRAGCED